MQFKDIIGQDKVKRHMLDMYANQRVPHAMLLLGPDGAGTIALAIAFAQYINCTGNKANGDSCGECPSCRKYAKMIHPDFHCIFPVVKKDESTSSDTFIDEWRSLICRTPYFDLSQWNNEMGASKQSLISKNDALAIHHKLALKPLEAQYQVLFMWRPELMNEAASNKILKILEEPPSNTLFILASNSATDILPTILSRTQILKVPPIAENDLTTHIVEKYNLSATDAQRIAHMSGGSYVDTMRIIDSSQESAENLDIFAKIMRCCYSRNVTEMIKISETVAKSYTREQVKDKLNYVLHMIRESFVMNLNNQQLNFITPAEEAFLQKFSRFIHADNVLQMADTVNEALTQIEQNGNVNIIIMDMLLQITIYLKKQRP